MNAHGTETYCPECGKMVKGTARYGCPHCGFGKEEGEKLEQKELDDIVVAMGRVFKIKKKVETTAGDDCFSFVYPELIKQGIIFAEDIEEAIIQYLANNGKFSEEKLRTAYFEFEDSVVKKRIPTKTLKIHIK